MQDKVRKGFFIHTHTVVKISIDRVNISFRQGISDWTTDMKCLPDIGINLRKPKSCDQWVFEPNSARLISAILLSLDIVNFVNSDPVCTIFFANDIFKNPLTTTDIVSNFVSCTVDVKIFSNAHPFKQANSQDYHRNLPRSLDNKK